MSPDQSPTNENLFSVRHHTPLATTLAAAKSPGVAKVKAGVQVPELRASAASTSAADMMPSSVRAAAASRSAASVRPKAVRSVNATVSVIEVDVVREAAMLLGL